MKSIIINMNDLSDSVEIYESKPNPFLIYTIYVILATFLIAIVWACFFKIDNVVKSNGIFRSKDEIYDISCAVSGQIVNVYVENGDYVEEGDTLCEVSIESLSDTIIEYQNSLQNSVDRLEMLDAYKNSLDLNIEIGEEYSDNQYYEEFVNRRALLLENIAVGSSNISLKHETYQGNMESISTVISQYEDKIDKLETAKSCVISRTNSFDSSESYYYSIVNSYISNYNYIKLQYDNTISTYQSQLDEVENQLESIENGSASAVIVESKSDLELKKESLETNIELSKCEQMQSLVNSENSQIAAIEQLIKNYDETLITLYLNFETAETENNAILDEMSSGTVLVLTEKCNIASERIDIENQKAECESFLKSYHIKDNNCTIVASASGYYYMSKDLRVGDFLQEGNILACIYPDNESGFYAELYVDNSDIGRLEVGQNVIFEMESFPTSEYGYFTGVIEGISKTITMDESTGKAYYTVKVSCEDVIVSNKDGYVAQLKNGMSCVGKVVIGKKTVMDYLLEKINLLD